MHIFKDTDFTWWQLGSLKWAVLCIGVAIGATWPQVFAPYVAIIFCVGLVLCIPPAIAWFRGK